jgi:Ca2+-binding RTX toxin-like protein
MHAIGLTLTAAGVLAAALVPAAAQSAAPPRCQGVEATIVGTDQRDDLTGTRGRDVIAGLGGWDRIDGFGGNDLVCGGEGTDRLRGGPGNDRLYGGPDGRIPDEPPLPVGDTLWGGPGNDRIDGGDDGGDDRVSYDTSTGGVSVSLKTGMATGQGDDRLVNVESITGSNHVDRLVAGTGVGSGYSGLSGLGGDDVIVGSPSVFRLDGGAGDDEISGGSADSFGGAGNDRLSGVADDGWGASLDGGPGSDELAGTAADDYLYGGGEADVIRSGDGRDTLDGGKGDDELFAGAGNDAVADGLGRDAVEAGAGDDTIRPRKGGDEIFDFGRGTDTVDYGAMYGSGIQLDLAAETSSGHAGNDTLRDVENVFGSNSDDVLTGSDAAERIEGWDGDDVINGMGGDDVIKDTWGRGELNGGPGDDRVVLSWVDGYAYDGGDGVDTLDARGLDVDEGESFVIDLAAGEITSPETATATGIENVVGQYYRDVIRGNAAANELIGGAGADRLAGRDGDDVLTGGRGTDNADGGPGDDRCTAETVTNCEG